MNTVLSPRGVLPGRDRTPLAPRGRMRRIAVVATMPPGSGVEKITEQLEPLLADAGCEGVPVLRRAFLADSEVERAELLAGGFDGAVLAVGHSTTVLAVSLAFAAALEAAGLPVIVAVPAALAGELEVLGPRAPAPVRTQLVDRSGDGVSRLLELLGRELSPDEAAPAAWPGEDTQREWDGEEDELQRLFEARGWTDGLPVPLPTVERVGRMLLGTSRDADEIVTACFPPEHRTVRVRDVAANAVLAGADAVHLPIILAAASLLGDPALTPFTSSVNSFAFAQLVTGSYAERAALNGGMAALSPGTKANAVIGRSVDLMLRNLGGATNGISSSPVQGTVGRWPFAFTENAAESPWAPYHRDLGRVDRAGAVTLFTGGQAHLGNFYYDDLDAIAAAMTSVDLYSGALVLLSAKRAQSLHERGMSRADVADYLQAHATVTLREFRASGFHPLRAQQIRDQLPGSWPASYLTDPDETVVPAFPPGSIRVAVVGSSVSSLVQVWLMRETGTASIDDWL